MHRRQAEEELESLVKRVEVERAHEATAHHREIEQSKRDADTARKDAEEARREAGEMRAELEARCTEVRGVAETRIENISCG